MNINPSVSFLISPEPSFMESMNYLIIILPVFAVNTMILPRSSDPRLAIHLSRALVYLDRDKKKLSYPNFRIIRQKVPPIFWSLRCQVTFGQLTISTTTVYTST